MATMVFVSQHEEISTRAPRFCVAYQAPHAVARDGTHAVAAKAPRAVVADGTHAVAGDGSDAVTADRRSRTCAVAAARRARRRGPGSPRTAPRVPLKTHFSLSGAQRTTHLVLRPRETFQMLQRKRQRGKSEQKWQTSSCPPTHLRPSSEV
jgi:hypothetical protein